MRRTRSGAAATARSHTARSLSSDMNVPRCGSLICTTRSAEPRARATACATRERSSTCASSSVTWTSVIRCAKDSTAPIAARRYGTHIDDVTDVKAPATAHGIARKVPAEKADAGHETSAFHAAEGMRERESDATWT